MLLMPRAAALLETPLLPLWPARGVAVFLELTPAALPLAAPGCELVGPGAALAGLFTVFTRWACIPHGWGAQRMCMHGW